MNLYGSMQLWDHRFMARHRAPDQSPADIAAEAAIRAAELGKEAMISSAEIQRDGALRASRMTTAGVAVAALLAAISGVTVVGIQSCTTLEITHITINASESPGRSPEQPRGARPDLADVRLGAWLDSLDPRERATFLLQRRISEQDAGVLISVAQSFQHQTGASLTFIR